MKTTSQQEFYMKRSKMPHFLHIVLLICLVLFLLIESSPFYVHHSLVLTSANRTEYQLTVILNTLLPVNRQETVTEIVSQHQRINGPRPEAFYEIRLYRTRIHYRLHIEYDVLYCDESGKLI